MAKGKAHCFKIWPEEGNSEQIFHVLRDVAKKRPAFAFDHNDQQVMICEQQAHTTKGQALYTASAFRVREGAHPSVVGETGVKPLSLPENEALGELMCLAFAPIEGNAAIF